MEPFEEASSLTGLQKVMAGDLYIILAAVGRKDMNNDKFGVHCLTGETNVTVNVDISANLWLRVVFKVLTLGP